MSYAKDTSVSVSKTEAEIKAVIRKYGATSFASFETTAAAMIAFEMEDRRIVFKLPLPDKGAREYRVTPTGKDRGEAPALAAWEQACRSRWRALFLCIKAKLESVEAGIETFDDAFLAHIQMPDGLTVGEHVRPKIAIAYQSESMPSLLPGPGAMQ
jgi:hypothetical protein